MPDEFIPDGRRRPRGARGPPPVRDGVLVPLADGRPAAACRC